MISRRELMAGSLAAPLMAQRAARTNPPNVILVLLDDLGCQDLGCFGAADLKTPNIDAVAATGVRWTNWYSNAPVCAPARASILTGRYPERAGVATNGRDLAPEQETIASVLKRSGYATASIGKWHLGSTDTTCPNAHGFDYFYGFHSGCVDFYSHRFYWGEPRLPNYHDLWRNRTEIFEDGAYLTERITEECVQFIDKNPQRPFFIYAAYNAPHYPMHAPAKYMARFADLPLERRTYAAMIAAVDDGVGQIRKALTKHGLLENTLIIVLGDNGATTEKRAGLNQEFATAGNNGRYRGFKFSLFDGGMHVPAMMSWPARLPGKTVRSEIAASMDILPTICEAAGVALPAGYTVDGTSLLANAAKGAPSPHAALCWAQGPQRAVLQGKWKLVVNGRTWDRTPEGGKHLDGEDAVFLSDLAADPGESRNLRRANPKVLDELMTVLARWEQAMGVQPAAGPGANIR